jgi:hypothetical protein
MKNFNQNQKKDLDQTIMEWLSDHSAAILIICAIASFVITGIVEFFHYKDVFGKSLNTELSFAISLLFAIFFQGVRCATIANSAKQFINNQKGRGIFILLVSLGVTVFCAYEAKQIAAIWEEGHPEIAGYIHGGVLCVVVAGWVLELILVVSVAGNANAATPMPSPKVNGREYYELDPLLNGNGATH